MVHSADVRYARLEDKDSVNEDSLPFQNLNPPRRAQLQQLSPYFIIYLSLSSIIIIILLAMLLARVSRESRECSNSRPFKTPLGRHLELMSVSHHYDELWKDVEGNSSEINIPDSSGNNAMGAIAMFHQLHCLGAFRRIVQMARVENITGYDIEYDRHWPHCFDYMRMTILCWADDTVERYSYDLNGERTDFIDGAFDLRQCGNNRKLIDKVQAGGKIVHTKPFP
ncbi:hypothetical protein NA57DRAFT_49970 [Rhizodiscina lignyota]|uniref:Uncharacterized protein n=1 Tax=Rhizodiscina lignyota TaxID=1504668 RepID=A0A9P4I2U5_9PEZI|nr:hypothetical protein NA57DRAFT_49970 [Rhizodiscina lignyota]